MCGSMSVIDRIEELGRRLESAGHEVVTPDRSELDDRWADLSLDEQVAAKTGFIDRYLDEIRRSDAVLVANFDTKGVDGYVGSNTLMEAAFAKAVGVPIYLVADPGPQPCELEILAITTGYLEPDLLPDSTAG